jgi:membrane-associated protease RseP (regulator of RpoE activity)
VGALVEPLTAQMADYLGVGNGLMVKQVARKSQAAVAGMKAFDVILKVGTDNIATVSDWDRAMRANQGKTVAVTILRDKKQQTVTLLVDTKKKGEVEFDGVFGDEDCPLMAFADRDARLGMMLDQSPAEEIRKQAEALQKQIEQWKNDPQIWHFEMSPEQAEEFRKQAEQFGDAFKDQNFGIDPKQMDELKKQMQEFEKEFNGKPFVFDQKQMDQWKQQIEQMQDLGFHQMV